MKFDDIKSFKDRFYTYKELPKNFKLPDYWMNYEEKPKFGDWILFRRICKRGIGRPILALCVGHTIYDQSLVLEYVENYRGFHHNSELLNLSTGCYYPVSDNDRKVENVIFWFDDIQILGHWKSKPSFRQLRKSLNFLIERLESV